MAEVTPNVSTNVAPEQTQDMPVSNQLQAPQSGPTAAERAWQPLSLESGTPPITATSPNVRTHAFIARATGALLDAIVGKPGPNYGVDSATGKMITTPAPPMSTSQKLARLGAHALEGLAANVPQQKSGLASFLSGVGGGARVVSAADQEADAAKQAQAKGDFEREQQMTFRKMEIAKANAQNLGLYFENVRRQNDLDPVRAQNKEIADAFRNISGHSVTEMDAEAARAAVADPNNQIWAHTHFILPAGMQPLTDDDGNPVKDAAGNFKSKGRVYVIDGTKDGKIPLPASVVSGVQKFKEYGDLAAIGSPLDGLKAGQEVDPHQFIKIYNGLLSAKVAVAKGWTNPDLTEDKDGKVIQHNTVSGEVKPATEAQTQKFQMDKANLAEKQQQARTSKATEEKEKTETQIKKQELAVGPTSNLTGEDYLKTLPAARQNTVRAVGEGRQVLPANRKEALALLDQVHQAYPDYDESLGKTWLKTRNEYMGSGQTAKKVVSYNTALEHMQDLYNNTTGEGIFNPVSKPYQDRAVAMGYVANEVGNAIKNGVMSKEEGQKILADLSGGITPANKRERIAETARLLHDKIEEYQNKFNEGAPSSAVKVPILISRRAAGSYDFVQSGGKAPQPQNQTTTPPTTHAVSLSTAMKNHPGMTEDQVRAWAKQNNYEVTQ